MIGKQFESNGQRLTVTGSYCGDVDDPPGYYYQFEGSKATHWISALGAAVRFLPVWPRSDREWALVNQPLTTD